jgi:hypothetical protein
MSQLLDTFEIEGFGPVTSWPRQPGPRAAVRTRRLSTLDKPPSGPAPAQAHGSRPSEAARHRSSGRSRSPGVDPSSVISPTLRPSTQKGRASTERSRRPGGRPATTAPDNTPVPSGTEIRRSDNCLDAQSKSSTAAVLLEPKCPFSAAPPMAYSESPRTVTATPWRGLSSLGNSDDDHVFFLIS